MSIFVCSVCGHIEFVEKPFTCPVCLSPSEKFTPNDHVFEESMEKSREAAVKHVPAVTVNRKCGLIPEQPCVDIIVRIGATLHPMENAHFIRFIDCYADSVFISRIQLTPGVYAAACFHLKQSAAEATIVESCNIHGHWKTVANL